jgi:hypothetical protein
MAPEFFVKAGKVRGGLVVLENASRRGPEQSLLQSDFIPAFRQQPADASCLSALEVPRDRSLGDRTTTCNLVLVSHAATGSELEA